MIPADVLQQVRRLHLRARRAVRTLLGGEYHSVFKGSGLIFDEVREYRPGDDVRTIDWNVTARTGEPFVKRFIEERELTVFLLADVSASLQFSSSARTLRVVAAEIAALIAFSAASNNDRVGLIAFSGQIERHVPPLKGTRHVLRVLRDILFLEPQHPGTQLRLGLEWLNQVQRRRAIVVLLSDFHDVGYETAFQWAGRRHDLIAVRLTDPRLAELPSVGVVRVQDAETGKQQEIDTAAPEVRRRYAELARQRSEMLRRLCGKANVDLVEVSTDGRHFEALLRFFHLRERCRRHSP